MKEKIAWFTPFNNTSSIARDSDRICSHLQKYYHIDIWTSDKYDLRSSSFNIINYSVNYNYSKKLATYDHIVYCMGNNKEYHNDIYNMSKKYKGIMLLHDQTYLSFFIDSYCSSYPDKYKKFGMNDFVNILRTNNYREIIKIAMEIKDNYDYFISLEKLKDLPINMLELVLENVYGVFSHANFFSKIVSRYTNSEYGYSYLPCDEPNLTEDEKKIIFEKFNYDKDKILIVSNGIVHKCKRIDKVVDVLCKNKELSDKIQYVVIGSYGGEYGEKLKKISETQLKNSLFILGYQDDKVMQSALYNADLCINLRYPNTEVFSMSLAEQMVLGKPVLVIGNCIYGEFPDDTVIKISLDKEELGIKRTLEKLIENRHCFDSVGKKAREFALKEFTAENYANKFIDFLKKYKNRYEIATFTNDIIDRIRYNISLLGINDYNAPELISRYVKIFQDIFNSRNINDKRNKTLGIWIGFHYTIPQLKREGITIWMRNLVESLIKYYDVNIELWGYECNKETIYESFDNIFLDDKLSRNIKLIHENNWQEVFNIADGDKYTDIKINSNDDNLNMIARQYSNASYFMPIIIYLDSVVGIDKPIFVPAHDMAVSDKYYDFIKVDNLYKSRALDILYRAENLARNGAKMYSISYYVRNNQILKYINNLEEKDSKVVYVPVTIADEVKILSEKEVRKKFNIKGRYIFYPTQNRPYKNIALIVKALNILKNEFHDLKLVLTGDPKDTPIVQEIIDKFKLHDRVLVKKDLTNEEMYSLFASASASAISSIFEGGFPLQAMEALRLDVPVTIADTEFSIERIEFMGFTKESCGIPIFNPYNENDLADKLRYLLNNKEEAINSQKNIKEKILSYTWKDVATIFYNDMFGI